MILLRFHLVTVS